MKCYVLIKNVYGEAKAYPGNAAAKVFANIAGTKTLTTATLEKIKDLGFKITFSSDLTSVPPELFRALTNNEEAV